MSTAVGRAGAASGGQLEEKVDFTEETTTKITQAQNLVATSPTNLREALALLAALEKRCRVGNDTPSLVRVCEASLDLCHDCHDNDAMISTIKTLTSRRSQKSKAVGAMVTKALPWVITGMDKGAGTGIPIDVNTEEERLGRDRLVVTLRDVTDGKIFLEAERARLTRALATIKEQEGNIAEAADILQEVHVETYGALSKREKVEFILEQMRLTLLKKDYIRAAIVSSKVNRKVLKEENMDILKIQFFTLMTKLHRHERDAFELAKDYHQIYCTPSVQNDESVWKDALKNTVLFLALSPYSMEQVDMLNRINVDSHLEKIDSFQSTIQLLLRKEIASHPIPHQSDLESLDSFTTGSSDEQDTELTTHWRETLRTRIVQHNVRVASLYYRRIHLSRLAKLLGLTPTELEKEVSAMVSDGSVYAKIDRPRDIVRFAAGQSPESVLTDWAGDITTLLDLVEKTTHLIHKEMTVAN